MSFDFRISGSSIFEEASRGMLEGFDAKDRAREEAFRISREVVRLCSSSIRCVHRNDPDEARRLLSGAEKGLLRIDELLRDHQDVRYSGFVDVAEQEYAEAMSFCSVTANSSVPSPEEVGVETVNYLAGLGDLTGELRRHILDLIRTGRADEGERFLIIIEEIHYLLMLFDYPDAITRGLRRKSDLARSMLERTRGDLTNALELARFQRALGRSERPEQEQKPEKGQGE